MCDGGDSSMVCERSWYTFASFISPKDQRAGCCNDALWPALRQCRETFGRLKEITLNLLCTFRIC